MDYFDALVGFNPRSHCCTQPVQRRNAHIADQEKWGASFQL